MITSSFYLYYFNANFSGTNKYLEAAGKKVIACPANVHIFIDIFEEVIFLVDRLCTACHFTACSPFGSV